MPAALPDWYSSLPDANAPQAASPATTPAAPAQNGNLPDWYSSLPDANPPIAAAVSETTTKDGQKSSAIPDWAKQVGNTAAQVPAGLIRGAVGAATMPLNIASMLQQPANWLADKAAAPLRSAMGKAPLTDADTQQINNSEQHIPSSSELLNKAGNAIGQPLPEPTNTASKFVDTASQFVGGGVPAGMKAIPAAIAGATSEGAGEATEGTPYELPARLIGGLVGGKGATSAADRMGAKETIANPVKPDEPIAASPKQMRTATQNVQASATDPQAVTQNLNAMQNGGEMVPGVKPTLGEVADDQGIAQAQNAMRQKFPEPFQAKDATRQQAISGQLDQMSNAGNPENIGSFVTKQLQDSDVQQNATEAGMTDRMNRGTQFFQQQGADQQAAQGAGISKQMNRIGQYGEMPQEGATSDTVLNARAVRGENEDKIWGVLKPIWDQPADMVTPRNAAQNVIDQSQEYGAVPLHAVEKQVTDSLLNPPDGAPDNILALKRFRTMVGEAQRSLPRDGSQATVMGRLQSIKNSIDDGLENTVNGYALQNESFYNKLLDAKENANAAATQQQAAGGNTSANLQGHEQAKPTLFSGASGTEGEAGSGPASSQRGQSIPGASAKSSFGQSELGQYKEARKTTFRNRVLDDLENSGAVNPNGQIDVKKFDRWYNKVSNKNRLSNDPDFEKQLTEVRGKQGDMENDAAKGQKNLEDYHSQFQEALDQYHAGRAQEAKDFQKTSLGKFVGDNADATKVVGNIFKSSKDSVKEFRDLADKVKTDPDALAGLRAATSRYINDTVAKASVDEGGKSGKVGPPDSLRIFINQNKNALREIYGGGQELNNLEAVAAEIRRNQKFEGMANIKGQSNTAKNAAQLHRAAVRNSVYGWVKKGLVKGAKYGGALLGYHHGGIEGGALGAAAGEGLGHIISSFKSTNLDTIEKIQLAMYDNPEFAKVMLQRFGSDTPTASLQNRIAAAALKMANPVLTTSSYGADDKKSARKAEAK